MTTTMNDCDSRVAAAYDWAAGLVGLARRLVGDGVDVDALPARLAERLAGELEHHAPVGARHGDAARVRDLSHRSGASRNASP